jgi:hypothetical protein
MIGVARAMDGDEGKDLNVSRAWLLSYAELEMRTERRRSEMPEGMLAMSGELKS